MARRDFLAKHLAHRAGVRREIGLLDRNATQRQQRLFDQLPTRAQIAARSADKHFRAVCNRHTPRR